jgi:cation diffusion facilitator CzcD-associated flavoprotein CzcO
MTAQQPVSGSDRYEMPRTADVIVIGGGPAGTAALWAIERLAPGTKTVLIEQSDHLARAVRLPRWKAIAPAGRRCAWRN